MSNAKDGVDVEQAERFLTNHLQRQPEGVALIGEGAWSRCFGFRLGAEALVIRFGKHVDDFQKDQYAYTFAAPGLPIPQVLAIGEAFAGYYAISTRADGVPLESLDASAWLAMIPAVVDALEAMRLADLSATVGIGGWERTGQAAATRWSSHLLAVAEEDPASRTYGWRARLQAAPAADATFSWGLDLLQQVVSDDVPRSLLHCDLINRNVLVNNARITGIFDWGCSRFGDHLYDLAWFEFWAPWYPQLDIQALRWALEERWRAVGYTPQGKAARLLTCYLHIGLDHLGYNAYLGDTVALASTVARMRTLAASA